MQLSAIWAGQITVVFSAPNCDEMIGHFVNQTCFMITNVSVRLDETMYIYVNYVN